MEESGMDDETPIPPFDFSILEETLRGVTFYGPWFVDALEEDEYDIIDATVGPRPGPHFEDMIATFSGANHNSVQNANAVAYVMTHLPEIIRLARLGASVENPARITDEVGAAVRAAAMKAVREFFEESR